MKRIIHVNQHNIKRNNKEGCSLPVITAKSYKDNIKTNKIILREINGKEIGRFVYSPDKPLACGAKVWFETDDKNILIETF